MLVLWALVILLIFPFYMFSQRELAPVEDQNVVFGIVKAPPNATLDQTDMHTDEIFKVYKAQPEMANTFQIMFPSGGFGGMVTKPRSERKKSTSQLQVETSQGLSKIAGLRVISLVPPALPGGGSFPVDLVILSTAGPEELSQFAYDLVGKAFKSGLFMYADTDVKFDQPQAEVVFDHDKVRAQGVDMAMVGRDLSTLLSGGTVIVVPGTELARATAARSVVQVVVG